MAAAFLMLPAAPASAAPTLTEFPLSTANSGPTGVTAGPDGALWITESLSNKIARMPVGGPVTEFAIPTPTSQPQAITAGPDGNLWFTESGGGKIGRITPGGVITEWPTPTFNSQPQDIVAGPDGALWFTEQAAGGAIGRITTSGEITEFRLGLTTNSQPNSITAGPDGNLWFTASSGGGRIGRITPSGTITEWPTPTVNSLPRGIAAGADGALWFTEQGAGGAIGRVTTNGVITEYRAGLTVNSQPAGIAAAADGSLYFAQSANPGRIGRVTTDGTITEVAVPTSGSKPSDVASGPDGNIWFTELANPGRVGRATVAPGVAAAAASDVTDVGATLAADIAANAQATQYRFEYGTTTAYGNATPLRSGGSAGAAQTFSAEVSGLAPNTTYHFRVVASNGTGTTTGPDSTFVTAASPPPPPPPAPPSVANSAASGIGRTAATLEADVDPEGQTTQYRFEYGPTASYGTQTDLVTVGSGASAQAVTAAISDLQPGTTYHFRIVATNATGTTTGSDTSFTTQAPPPPAVSGVAATGVGESTATLEASVDPGGRATHVYFEYGKTTAYGAATPEQPVGDGLTPQSVAAALSHLLAGTTYHYRVVASSASGTTASDDATFVTAAAPTPMPTPTPTPTPEPDAPVATPDPGSGDGDDRPADEVAVQPPPPPVVVPTLGETLVVAARGTVLVRRPGARGFARVSASRSVPVGSEVDATAGVLTLTTALPGGQTQDAKIWGGRVVVEQRRSGKGLVDLRLSQRALGCRRPGATRAVTAAKRRKRPAVWVKDHGGRFRSRGRNSVATVRGTTWLTKETCAGTLTRVTEGSVVVRDLRAKRTVVVKAGEQHLARRR